MKEFRSTYLCIKWHPVDPSNRQDGKGLFYFCKTTYNYKKMLSYKGSGDRWKAHIRKYKEFRVKTLAYRLFTNKDELGRVALLFSEQQNIIKSKLWANEKIENGLDGGGDYWLGKKNPIQAEKMKGNTYGKGSKGKERPYVAERQRGKKRPDHSEKMKGNTYGERNNGKKRPEISKAKKGKRLSAKVIAARTGKKRGPYKKKEEL